jgi:hypothetical protein
MSAPFYSPKEVVELIAKAKELGVTEFKVAGFEVSFKPQGFANEARRDQKPQRGKKCACGNWLKKGDFGYFKQCDTCFGISRRRNGDDRRNWRREP